MKAAKTLRENQLNNQCDLAHFPILGDFSRTYSLFHRYSLPIFGCELLESGAAVKLLWEIF